MTLRNETAPPPTRFRWAIVAILCAVAFVLYVDRINISIAVPHIANEFSLSQQGVGNILSAFLFGYAFGLIPGGWLADRFGAHKVLTTAGICWAVLTCSAGCIRSEVFGQRFNAESTLIVLRFMLGLAEACAYPTFARALANWLRHSETGMASGLIHMGSNLGGVFTPVWVAFIISRLGWRYSFQFSGGITLVAVILWWWGATDDPSQHPRVSESELRGIVSEREELKVTKVDGAWYKQLVRSRNAYMLCASELFYGLSGFVFLTWFYIYYTQVRGGGTIYSALLTSLIYIAGAIGALSGGILCDRSFRKWGPPWGRRLVPLVAITASGVFCIVAPSLRNNSASGIVFAMAAGLQFFAAPAFWATVIDITRRGPAIVGGFMNGSGNLGAAIGTITFPWLVSRVGYQSALQLAGVAGIISGFLWFLVDSSRRIDSSSSPEISICEN
jgi:ACS family glucarate transporter-like MFS transporter